jgi:hypothetical protein
LQLAITNDIRHQSAITNHYVYIRLKPGAQNFKAGLRNMPHGLLGRLKTIVQSMVEGPERNRADGHSS